MKKKTNRKFIILLIIGVVFLLFTIPYGIGRYNINNSKSFNNLVDEISEKGYDVQISKVDLDFLNTSAKRLTFENSMDNEFMDIYIFSSNSKMEKYSNRIDKDGFGYTDLTKSVQVDWVSEPHFYNDGNIIVQYVGTNEEIIFLLENILGEQFAGIY